MAIFCYIVDMKHERQTANEKIGFLAKLRRNMGNRAAGNLAPSDASELAEAKNVTSGITWKTLSVLEAAGVSGREVRVVSPDSSNATEMQWREEFDIQGLCMDEDSATIAVGSAGVNRRAAKVGLEITSADGAISSIVDLRMKPTSEQIQNGGAEAAYNEHYRLHLDAEGNVIRQEKIVTTPKSGPQVYELGNNQGITGSVFDLIGRMEEAVHEQFQSVDA